MRQGNLENLPYAFSRWTDVAASKDKWAWLLGRLNAGSMLALDPREVVPCTWSLEPEHVVSLQFWTKDPRRIADSLERFRDYPDVRVFVTATGWAEMEPRAPSYLDIVSAVRHLVAELGSDRVSWRFSPIPLLPTQQIWERFAEIATVFLLPSVTAAFIQQNDWVIESRNDAEKLELLAFLDEKAQELGVKLHLCQEEPMGTSTSRIICAPPLNGGPSERCGCAYAVDPFGPNEACNVGCRYCYAGMAELSPRKRNTTLIMLRKKEARK